MDATTEDRLREKAARRLRARRALPRAIVNFVIVNAVLIVIWAVTGRGYFWPGIVLGCWGFFLVLDIWTAWTPFVYVPRPVTDEEIDREVQRLQRRSGGGAATA